MSMEKHEKRTLPNWAIALLIGIAGCALYLPFISNPLVFDDEPFFYATLKYSYYAITPFDFAPRTFPFFTFAFVQTITQSFEAQRVVNLVIHGINAYLLFILSRELLAATRPHSTEFAPAPQTTTICAAIALIFLLHPVAVYGVGYLAQRTILIAVLFCLSSQFFLVKALRGNRWNLLFIAALLSSLSIYAKEHAIAFPLTGALLLFTLQVKPSSEQIKKIAVYLLLCTPTLIWVIYRLKHTVGEAYEPFVNNFAESQALIGSEQNTWLLSVFTECGLYFQYLRLWLAPDTALMSIDLRVTFVEHWLSLRSLFNILAFLGSAILGAYLVLRSRRFKLAGYGILYSQVVFLTELATIRIQEPFVLYRSYLWAPGFLMIGLNILAITPPRLFRLFVLIALPILALQSIDRLTSMKTSSNLWEDAELKLQAAPLPGAFRIYYNLGIEKLRAQKSAEALGALERCQDLSPGFFGCLSAKASALVQLKRYNEALMALDTSLAIAPNEAATWETKGQAHEALGQTEQANAAYAKSEALGGSLATILRKSRAKSLTTLTSTTEN